MMGKLQSKGLSTLLAIGKCAAAGFASSLVPFRPTLCRHSMPQLKPVSLGKTVKPF